MHPLVIIDADKDVREILDMVTHEEGYHSTLFLAGDTAVDYLRQLSYGTIVLFEHSPLTMQRYQSLLWYLLEEDTTLRQQHAYVLMTTNALNIPTHHLLQTLQMPLLYKPFALADLLLTLHQAAQHLEASEHECTSFRSSGVFPVRSSVDSANTSQRYQSGAGREP